MVDVHQAGVAGDGHNDNLTGMAAGQVPFSFAVQAVVVQRFLSQPFHMAEAFSGVPGVMVSIEDTIKGFNMIMDGEVDDIPEQAFLNVGTIEDAKAKAEKLKHE